MDLNETIHTKILGRIGRPRRYDTTKEASKILVDFLAERGWELQTSTTGPFRALFFNRELNEKVTVLPVRAGGATMIEAIAKAAAQILELDPRYRRLGAPPKRGELKPWRG